MSSPAHAVVATARPTLERLLGHARTLLRPRAVAYAERSGTQVATWTAAAAFDEVMPRLASLVAGRDRPLLLPRLDAWQGSIEVHEGLVRDLGESRAQAVWDVAAGCSLLIVPVCGSIGQRLGTIVALREGGEAQFSAADLRNAQVLADLSALALERAELVELESRRAHRELRLKRASEEIAASLDPEAVVERLAEQARAVTGGEFAIVLRLEPGATRATLAAAAGIDRAAARAESLDSGLVAEVARSRRPWLGDASGWRGPATVSVGSLALAPLGTGARVRGVVCVGHPDPQGLDHEALEALVELLRFADVAIANALEHTRERRIAEALTLGFVPAPLPALPGYELGLVYEPAADAITGGDVYGAWELNGGAIALLVGDAAGKGVESAALSAMVRFFAEARSADASDPLAAFAEVNRLLARRLPNDVFVTAFFAVLQGTQIDWALAGHLPPVLIENGEIRELGPGGLPLGITEEPQLERGAHVLRPGATLVAYTDGVVEARRERELFGRERLLELLRERAHNDSAQQLAEAVREAVLAFSNRPQDDLLVLVVRRSAG